MKLDLIVLVKPSIKFSHCGKNKTEFRLSLCFYSVPGTFLNWMTLIFQIHTCNDYYEEQVNANEFGRRQRPTNIKLNIIFKIWWFKIILSTSIAGHFDPAEDNF